MTINYIDYSDLIEVLGLPEIDDELVMETCPEIPVQNYINKVADLFIFNNGEDNIEEINSTVSKCRDWLTNFSQNNNHHAGGLTYRKMWIAMLQIKDDYSFLKAFSINLPLMWD